MKGLEGGRSSESKPPGRCVPVESGAVSGWVSSDEAFTQTTSDLLLTIFRLSFLYSVYHVVVTF